jgi:Tfp pilus assembly protein PilF
MTYIGRGFLRMQRFDSASAIFERALALNEDFKTPLVYLAASEINRMPPNIARAKEALEKYLSETPPAGAEGNAPQEGELVQYAKTLLDEIRRQHVR